MNLIKFHISETGALCPKGMGTLVNSVAFGMSWSKMCNLWSVMMSSRPHPSQGAIACGFEHDNYVKSKIKQPD